MLHAFPDCPWAVNPGATDRQKIGQSSIYKLRNCVAVWFLIPFVDRKRATVSSKCWEIIADNLSKAEWSWRCVSTVDSNGRTIFVADAHRDDGKRFVVRADDKLTAFLELESAIRGATAL